MHKQSVIPLEVREAMAAYETAAVNLAKAVAKAFPIGSEILCQSSRMRSPGVRVIGDHGGRRHPATVFIKAPVGINQEIVLDFHQIELVKRGQPRCSECDEVVVVGTLDDSTGEAICEDCKTH